MLDIKYIRENPEKVKEGCIKRGMECDVSRVLELDEKRKELLQKIEGLKAQQNKLGKEDIEEAKKLKEEIKKLEPQMEEVEGGLHSLLCLLPNIPQDDVPVGDASKNMVLRQVGKPPKFSFEPKDHLFLGEELDVIDVQRASKVSGSRFVFVKGDMMQAMGYVDTAEDLAERYYFDKEGLFLVGTGEQSVGPMHQGEVFEDKELPKRYAAFSTCFREEAGSYG